MFKTCYYSFLGRASNSFFFYPRSPILSFEWRRGYVIIKEKDAGGIGKLLFESTYGLPFWEKKK